MAARLSPERWREVIPHLDRALDLDREARGPWLAALRARDAALADDIAALLERHDALDDGFLGTAPAVPPAPSLAGLALGPYTLREQIGQGGMGGVWLAARNDGRFEGVAAVKLLNASLVGRDGEARFRREGSILARLRHPHIAQLKDAGVSPLGQPYLVLEHVDGERIDRHCDARRMGVEARIRLFLDVVGAVAHAHQSLVVHRDLKPSNVLVGKDGRVKLLDFGIAKLLEGDAGTDLTALTREGQSALTPEYAAPEQLTGGDVTTATDVYALGVLLYVLLTGRHPAGALGSAADLVQAIVRTEPARASDAVTLAAPATEADDVASRRATTPARLRRALRGDLDNIVGRALKKQPSERYASAEAMADDLRRYLDRRPVSARADSLGYRARKFVSRNRLPLAAAVTVVAALVTGAGIAIWQGRQAARERDRALVELHRAEATNDLANFLLQQATPSAGRPISNAELLARAEALVDRRFAGDAALRVHMLLGLSDRFYENRQFDRWQAVLDRAFVLSRGIGDAGLRARAACAKANGLADRGRHGEADALVAAALAEVASAPGTESDEAYCRIAEATSANGRGDAPRALAAATRAVTLEDARPGPEGRGFEALYVLGTASLVAERYAEGDRTFRRLMERLERQGLGETRTAASVLNNWSVLLVRAGHWHQAVPLYERAVRIGREQDTENGPSPTALRNYGTALCKVGRCAEGIPLLEESVARTRAAASTRRLVDALVSAAAGYREASAFERAHRALAEAEALLAAEPVARPDRLAVLDRSRARLALARGEKDRALAHVQRGFARQADPDRGDWETLDLLLVLAAVENERRDHASARAAADRAVGLATAHLGGMAHSDDAGQAHLERGVALAGQGDREAALAELGRALEHLRPTLGAAAAPTRRAQAEIERLAPRMVGR